MCEQNAALQQLHQQCLMELLREFDRVCKALEIPYMLFAGSMLGAVRHEGIIPWDDDVDVILLRPDYERLLREAQSVLHTDRFFLQKEYGEHWPMFFSKLRLNGTTCLERYHPKDPQTHQGIYLDILPCDAAAKIGLGRVVQFCAAKVVIAKALDQRGYETRNLGKRLFLKICRLLPWKPFYRIVVGGRSEKTVHTFLAASSAYGKNVWPKRYFEERVKSRFGEEEYPISAHFESMLRQLYGDYQQIPTSAQRSEKQHAWLVDPDHSYEHYADCQENVDFAIHTRSRR